MITGFTLPGMIDEPGWVSGRAISAIPARGPIASSRRSEPIFQSDRAIVRSAAVGGDRRVERRLGVEVVRRLADLEAGEGARGARQRPAAYVRVGVDPGPDGGPAERHGEQLGLGGARPADRLLDLAGVAAELLAEPDRRRVLEVRPAGLDHRPELVRLGVERRAERSRAPGRSASSIAIAAESWSAVGITSFEDWHLLTWSFGWTFVAAEAAPLARWATTSFMFVFVEVPEPVW